VDNATPIRGGIGGFCQSRGQPEKIQAKIIRNTIEICRNLLTLNILVFHILFQFLAFYSISAG